MDSKFIRKKTRGHRVCAQGLFSREFRFYKTTITNKQINKQKAHSLFPLTQLAPFVACIPRWASKNNTRPAPAPQRPTAPNRKTISIKALDISLLSQVPHIGQVYTHCNSSKGKGIVSEMSWPCKPSLVLTSVCVSYLLYPEWFWFLKSYQNVLF